MHTNSQQHVPTADLGDALTYHRLTRAFVAATLFFDSLAAAGGWLFRAWRLDVVACAVLLCCGAGILAAQPRVRRRTGALILAAACFTITLSIGTLTPWAVASTVLTCVIGVVVALPYVEGRRLAWVMGTSFIVVAVVALSGRNAPLPLWPPWLLIIMELGGVMTSMAIMLLSLWDFSSRLRAELAERKRLQDATSTALEQRQQFIAVAAHELRTPLTALTLQLQRARRCGDNVRREGLLNAAEQSVLRLTQLAEALLNIERWTNKEMHIELRENNVAELVGGVAASLAEQIANTGCALTVRSESYCSAMVDPALLTVAVQNLMSNALKYGRGKPIIVRVSDTASSVRISVQDQGIGIAPADRERIFRAFERGVSVRHFSGFGLGLAVCTQIVAAHGGHIELESEVGKGSTFTIEIPRKPLTVAMRPQDVRPAPSKNARQF